MSVTLQSNTLLSVSNTLLTASNTLLTVSNTLLTVSNTLSHPKALARLQIDEEERCREVRDPCRTHKT